MKPVLQALVLAEHVYEEKSGKKIICGTFTGLRFSKIPIVQEIEADDGTKRTVVTGGAHAGSPYAYISLTDVVDNTELGLQFVSLKRNQVMFSTSLVVKCNDRLATVEIIAPLPPLIVPEEGVYAFEIVCDGEVIGTHRIVATEITQQG